MAKKKTTAERGKFKQEIHSALYKNSDLRELLIGDTAGMKAVDIQAKFKEYVKSHLFIDDTIQEAASFIFYDVVFPNLRSQTKDCRIILYAICHRDILEDYTKAGYFGDRSDIMAQMIEDALINDESVKNKFGIGELTLDSVDIYNATRFYGCKMDFSVPNFR